MIFTFWVIFFHHLIYLIQLLLSLGRYSRGRFRIGRFRLHDWK